MADSVLVNSEFTASTFGSTFTRLEARGLHPAVLYPAVDFHQFDTYLDNPPDVKFIPGLSAEGLVRLRMVCNEFEIRSSLYTGLLRSTRFLPYFCTGLSLFA